jgi:hypothetical protein
MARLGVLLVLLTALAAAGLCWLEVNCGGLDRLHGRLSRMEIQFDCWGGLAEPGASAWQGKWVGTDDPAFLARVETWLQALRRPACGNALRQRGGRVVLTFRDGRQEELLFRGPGRPGPSAGRCGGFLWEGLDLVGGEEPLTDFLRDLSVDAAVR